MKHTWKEYKLYFPHTHDLAEYYCLNCGLTAISYDSSIVYQFHKVINNDWSNPQKKLSENLLFGSCAEIIMTNILE